ncbi:DNA metabolism protein [Salmonella enterica subsp. enterica serovar Abony]|nr:DNA metabolism protein [Salmonella enterica subsp. enterica serovar Abony]EBY6401317.1 DNA metabolism protein [Salmonella enterica subsp. enterica serovar Abony]MKM03012.1 DNA metabolism protein [Salmonella enterica subsp. enterica serovar Isaszeg]
MSILFVIFRPGSARNSHVQRVRSGFCALPGFTLAPTSTPTGIDSWRHITSPGYPQKTQ